VSNAIKVLLGAFPLIVGGCALILGMAPLRVTDWHPRTAQLSAPSVGEIWVEFSGNVDRTKAEQAFSMSENSAPLKGNLSWSGNKLFFAPWRPVSDGNDYEIAVLSSAETIDGNSLSKEFRFAFSTKWERGRPTVRSIQPSDGSRIAISLLPVVVTFSEPVDTTSFLAAWSISPDPGGSISFDSTALVATFTPLAEWRPGTEYSVSISDSLKDAAGNHLAAAFRTGFCAGADGVRPVLVAVRSTRDGLPRGTCLTPEDPNDSVLQINSDFESTWGLEIEFSEPVQRPNIESFIDVEPAWGFQIDPSGAPRTSYSLVPKERFVWGDLYGLTIRHGVVDTSGNTLAADTSFFFRVNGAASRPPGVERIRFRTNPADSLSPAYGDFTSHDALANLDLSFFTPGVDTATNIDVYLRIADGASIDPFSFMRSFWVTATNGAALITPTGVATMVFNDPQPLPVAGLAPVRVTARVTNTTNSGVITLGVSESLADSAGNVAAAAFSLPLLK
jgi:hypothetical protein